MIQEFHWVCCVGSAWRLQYVDDSSVRSCSLMYNKLMHTNELKWETEPKNYAKWSCSLSCWAAILEIRRFRFQKKSEMWYHIPVVHRAQTIRELESPNLDSSWSNQIECCDKSWLVTFKKSINQLMSGRVLLWPETQINFSPTRRWSSIESGRHRRAVLYWRS